MWLDLALRLFSKFPVGSSNVPAAQVSWGCLALGLWGLSLGRNPTPFSPWVVPAAQISSLN